MTGVPQETQQLVLSDTKEQKPQQSKVISEGAAPCLVLPSPRIKGRI